MQHPFPEKGCCRPPLREGPPPENYPTFFTINHMVNSAGGADHLACLSATDLFSYLSQYHDATIMAVLLGIGAAKAGKATNQLLCLHPPYSCIALCPVVSW